MLYLHSLFEEAEHYQIHCCIIPAQTVKCAEERSCGLTSWFLPLEEGAVCLQLLCVKSTGYEATVSH